MGDVVKVEEGMWGRPPWTDAAEILQSAGWAWRISKNGASRFRTWNVPGTDLWVGETVGVSVLQGWASPEVMAEVERQRKEEST